MFEIKNEDTGMLDLSLMKSLIQQVWYKKSIHEIQMKYGMDAVTKTPDEVFLEGLKELRLCKP